MDPESSFFEHLPDEIIVHILETLNLASIIYRFRLTCRRHLLITHEGALWKYKILRDFGSYASLHVAGVRSRICHRKHLLITRKQVLGEHKIKSHPAFYYKFYKSFLESMTLRFIFNLDTHTDDLTLISQFFIPQKQIPSLPGNLWEGNLRLSLDVSAGSEEFYSKGWKRPQLGQKIYLWIYTPALSEIPYRLRLGGIFPDTKSLWLCPAYSKMKAPKKRPKTPTQKNYFYAIYLTNNCVGGSLAVAKSG